MRYLRIILAAASILMFSRGASAHITLDIGQAVAGSYYKAVLRVPHGCDGSPTVKIHAQIPQGVTGIKPRPKAGWKLSITKAKLAAPIEGEHGNKITEGVREVTWSEGRLPDDQYDEFEMLMKLPNTPNAILYIPVVQECVKGINRWIEIPESGKGSGDYKKPAPSLKLIPKS